MATERAPGGSSAEDGLRADLLLEAAGVNGIALLGAVRELARAGYSFPRVAGTSSGAVVGALVAALGRSGEPLSSLGDIAATIDYRRLRDRGGLGRLAGPLRGLANGMSLAFDGGIFEGEYLRSWLAGTLADLGVRTFGDLRTGDGAGPGSWPLVVTASDLSRRRLVRLPWDYPAYGLDADDQPVADAVRASASIPFYYEPVTVRSRLDHSVSTLVDGSLLSAFPIAMFDRTDGQPPRWPTFGIRLSSGPAAVGGPAVRGPVSLALAVVQTLMETCDARHIHGGKDRARSVFIDTTGVAPLDVRVDDALAQELLRRGADAVHEFLTGWSWPNHLAARSGEKEST